MADSRVLLATLLGAVACLLLVACANVGNLLLARASRRRQELAVRRALGAGRLAIARQLLAESLVLALTAGVVGTGLAMWLLPVLVAVSPGDIPRMSEATVDGRVLRFAVFVSMMTAAVAGLAPLTQSRRGDLLTALGIYTVIAYLFEARTREVGVRIALGAQRGNVIQLLLRQGSLPVGVGLVVGLLATIASTRWLTSLLFGVTATDLSTIGAVIFILCGVAFLAILVSARRAARLDPVVALRHE